MNTITDPDIGLCDDCSSEEGRRAARSRVVTLNGEQVRIRVWLCRECRGPARD